MGSTDTAVCCTCGKNINATTARHRKWKCVCGGNYVASRVERRTVTSHISAPLADALRAAGLMPDLAPEVTAPPAPGYVNVSGRYPEPIDEAVEESLLDVCVGDPRDGVVVLHTDGSAHSNIFGGWAALIVDDVQPPRLVSGWDWPTNAYAMEIRAVREGLLFVPPDKPVVLISDHLGVINAVRTHDAGNDETYMLQRVIATRQAPITCEHTPGHGQYTHPLHNIVDREAGNRAKLATATYRRRRA